MTSFCEGVSTEKYGWPHRQSVELSPTPVKFRIPWLACRWLTLRPPEIGDRQRAHGSLGAPLALGMRAAHCGLERDLQGAARTSQSARFACQLFAVVHLVSLLHAHQLHNSSDRQMEADSNPWGIVWGLLDALTFSALLLSQQLNKPCLQLS